MAVLGFKHCGHVGSVLTGARVQGRLLLLVCCTVLGAEPSAFAARPASKGTPKATSKGRSPPPPPAAPAPEPPPEAPAPTPDAAPAAAPEVVPTPMPVPKTVVLPKDTGQLVLLADKACQEFDLEVCVALSQALLARGDVRSEQQQAAYANLAAAFAVMGDPSESERYYRLLLRLKPDFTLGPDAPPKMTVVFQKVQADEARLRQTVQEAERRRLVESIALDVMAPLEARGGQPITIRANARAPLGGVAAVVLKWRRDPTSDFSAQPMKAAPDGTLQVVFPAEQTVSDKPALWEYMVVAESQDGTELKSSAAPGAPHILAVAAGNLPSTPFWRLPAFWWIVGPAAGGLGALAFTVVLVAAGVVVTSLVAAWLYSIQPPRGELGSQRL